MTGLTLPFIMDALVILLLAGTIFYAARLSIYIRAFQESREDLEKLIGDLSDNIERADRAIEGLRENARQSGRDLQEQINEAQGLSEELQIMSQAGDSLAGRLEKLAEKNARPSGGMDTDFIAQLKKRPAVSGPSAPERYEESPRETVRPEPVRPEPMAGFAIRDREFDEGMMDEDGLLPGDYEDESGGGDFSSRAERELYEALQNRRKARTGAGGVS